MDVDNHVDARARSKGQETTLRFSIALVYYSCLNSASVHPREPKKAGWVRLVCRKGSCGNRKKEKRKKKREDQLVAYPTDDSCVPYKGPTQLLACNIST